MMRPNTPPKTSNSRRYFLVYDWKRRWIPTEIGGSDGTAATSRARAVKALWELQFTSDGVLFDEIRHVPCLILLGEPGIGKTNALQQEQWHIDTKFHTIAHKTLLVDLADDNSIEQLFEDENYHKWKTGARRLTMFVDSVDQAGISVDKVIRRIGNELNGLDVSQLHLRLACRDHEWSLTLADMLRHTWRRQDDTAANVRVYQLAPLGPDDIRVAAEANSSTIQDPERFLDEIEAADAWALATVPITLKMLLKYPEYLTRRGTELYVRGLIELCTAVDTASGPSSLELDMRFETAARIAAIMVLSRKHSVDVYAPDVPDSSSALAVRDLLLGDANEREEKQIRAVLDLPLFQGTGNRKWAHQSYAEYLAAHCVSDESIPISEIVDRTVAPDEKFASYLHDTLRWLIELRPEVLSEVIQRQPMLVLATDVSHLSEEEFRKLFAAVLNLPDPYVYSHEAWNLRKFRASHPSAKSILLPYLTDTTDSPYLRRFVLRLMERLDIRDIDDELVRIALDENEDQVLKHWAARRIRDDGSVESKRRLEPYIYSRDDDPEDELKGYALQMLWPDLLTADELFNALSPPKKQTSGHTYRTFLYGDSIMEQLQVADLITALKWVTEQSSHHEMSFALNDLPGAIMRKSWDNIHVPGVMGAFTRTAIEMDARFDGIFGGNAYDPRFKDEEAKYYDRFEKEVEARRRVVTTALPIWREKDTSTTHLVWGSQPILLLSDLEWLIGLLDVSTESDERCQLVNIIAGFFRRLSGTYNSTAEENYRRVERVCDASDKHPELQQLVQRYSISMLDDPGVVSHREHIRQMREIDQEIAQQRSEVRPFEWLQEALALMEAGETLQWIYVCAALTSIPGETYNAWSLNPDFMDFPTWQSCDDATQERVVRAAQSYAMTQDVIPADDNSEDWYDTGQIPRVEFYGYSAIFLLIMTNAKTLSQLPADRWKRWSKIIVWYPYAMLLSDGRTDYHREILGLQQDILRRLNENAPRAFMDNLRSLLLAEDRRDTSIGQTLRKVDHLWDPEGSDFEHILLDLLRDSSLSPKGQRSILDFLLAKQSVGALRFAEVQIASGYASQVEKDRVVEFAVSLMVSNTEFDRSVVWDLLQNDDAVGREIVKKLAEEDWHEARFVNKLSAPELVDLFIWMEELYPTSEDPQIDGIHAVTTREQVGRLRKLSH